MAKNIIETKGKFIAILQPVIYVGDFKKDHLEDKIDYDLEENFKIVYKLIKSKANYKLGESFIDLTYALNNKDYYFIDYCHLSPNGNLLIVNQLTNALKNYKYFEKLVAGVGFEPTTFRL